MCRSSEALTLNLFRKSKLFHSAWSDSEKKNGLIRQGARFGRPHRKSAHISGSVIAGGLWPPARRVTSRRVGESKNVRIYDRSGCVGQKD